MATTFPQQHARTHRFTLGAPRSFTVAPDGTRVAFLRSRGGTDLAHLLWVRDVAEGTERIAADPRALLGGAEEELSPEERARRERSREGTAGVVGYATDSSVEMAAFALSGRLFTAELRAGTARELATPTPVVDPRPAPDGRHIAYVSGGTLRVIAASDDGSGGSDRALTESGPDTVTWGLAEFIAAEEMSRTRGFWWSPDSDRLLVARVDDAPVARWWIADPAHPESEPARVAYPAAGTGNAEVTLHFVGLDGSRTEVSWDRERYPYLARVHWSSYGPPLLLVQSRDQREAAYLTVDTGSGATSVTLTEKDPIWLELFGGVPAWAPDGSLVRMTDGEGAVGESTPDGEGARVLMAGARRLTSSGLHVRAVLDIGDEDVLFSASEGETSGRVAPGDVGVYQVPLAGGEPVRLATEEGPHVASAARGGGTLVLSSATLERPGSRAVVLRQATPTADTVDAETTEGTAGTAGAESAAGERHRGLEQAGVIASGAETPVLATAPRLLHTGRRRIPAAVVLPSGYREGDGPLPVLMDPYGGPHGQRVVAAHNAHLTAQWFADQGFAVVAADGRGTPGYSPGWEKAVHHDLAHVTLDDQVEALHSLADSFPLDLTRVGIRGWSYGGYLSALAVLRRPDVFHAAVAGAPVTDWRLYDTHYTERYCGTPQDDPAVYAEASLVTDEGLSGVAEDGPHRPLMIIHGLADDNVVVAHALRLSSALLAAGRGHEVLPLSGVTHMASGPQVAENLLLLQVGFLKRSLGID
ncbi:MULTISPECIES: prolyl oligopeptidase family serine peptidase [unclassified Streptomyces]|uniref:S9 family peptidase n=1 Tax=unclassified Streptomyces TaxID=2593676 RepID=UPI002E0F8F09|nr:prolyl oligopeptidase family serine peptidase [Streptomyces sp. NBC_01186]WSS43647.1 prolyl oligopeptidase family serine peptidase [Streptomyces sp. NBC_01187]